ncbi:MAG TPA: HNH endonuclease signature motif containing protein [Chloroflexota bacterium]
METETSGIPFSYTTITVTKSRIDKGLLAIPASLMDHFPSTNGYVQLSDGDGRWARKSFTAYDSSSKECRIGGMGTFYSRYHIESGDELVLHVLGKGRYQLLPEKAFREKVVDLESNFDNAPTEGEAEAALFGLATLTRNELDEVARSEYLRAATRDVVPRAARTRADAKSRELIPPSLRRLLASLYKGRCQVSGFSFLKRTGEPYFEVHHIDPLHGHHVKNVLVVSANVHAQFTFAEVEESFDKAGWLRRVEFNDQPYPVFQIIDELPSVFQKEVQLA